MTQAKNVESIKAREGVTLIYSLCSEGRKISILIISKPVRNTISGRSRASWGQNDSQTQKACLWHKLPGCIWQWFTEAMHFSKSFGNFERQLPLKKGIGKFQRHLPLKLNQSPSKLGSLPVEVIGFSSQGQNAYRTLVSEACLCHYRVIFFNSALRAETKTNRKAITYQYQNVKTRSGWFLEKMR